MKKIIFCYLLLITASLFLHAQDQYRKLYYENGAVKGVGKMDSVNQMNGEWTFYNPNGIKKSSGIYNHGKANGCWFFWSTT